MLARVLQRGSRALCSQYLATAAAPQQVPSMRIPCSEVLERIDARAWFGAQAEGSSGSTLYFEAVTNAPFHVPGIPSDRSSTASLRLAALRNTISSTSALHRPTEPRQASQARTHVPCRSCAGCQGGQTPTSLLYATDDCHSSIGATSGQLLVQANATANFNETIDVCIALGTNPKRGDQMVRGACTLPHGTGKEPRICVFANEGDAADARAAGALAAYALPGFHCHKYHSRLISLPTLPKCKASAMHYLLLSRILKYPEGHCCC